MIKTTTIRIDADIRYTAQQTQAKKKRGGFSEYVELLIIADLKKNGIELIKEPIK
jgi:hypothetical protein